MSVSFNSKKNFLFFFVHPSKYYLFRVLINHLKHQGHIVDVVIISKDVLESLVKSEGWEYINLFPEGRRSKSSGKYSILFSTAINFLKTLWRLHWITAKKQYDIFVTDDCLTITGYYRKIKSYIFCDDDISVIKETSLLFSMASYIIAPYCTDFGKYNVKKIGFNGYKASSYLHPDVFVPKPSILKKYNLVGTNYFIIRLVSLTATHDTGKKGISDGDIVKIIAMLSLKGDVIISSERALSPELEKYRKSINAEDVLHVIAFAEMFISDSQTMSMEAAFLGVPYIRFNDFVGKISYLEELENKHKLGVGILTKDKEVLFNKINELKAIPNKKEIWRTRRDSMLANTVNLNKFLIDLLE